ncbi:dual specificity protein phosphatase CDC14AB-like [Phymastichus coffea]|uniref:dual specificity protein phosphatase CDC14AB-like n=1 Tax=Phymastichus coffea TaxID=108790 RepID=UPI00273B43D8|nr:dual specificity protein phosphatase CDC14AB-like [Phymastichus coffea]
MSGLHTNFMSLVKPFSAFLKRLKQFTEHDLKNYALDANANMLRRSLNHFVRSNDPENSAFNYRRSDKSASYVNIYRHPDLMVVSELIENRFYFATVLPGKFVPKDASNIYFFNTDDDLVYDNFYNDFGPLSIACLYRYLYSHSFRYCRGVNKILRDFEGKLQQICHFSRANPDKRANAAFLATSYSVLYLKQSPIEAFELIAPKDAPPLKPFQDASIGSSCYNIKLIDCLKGLSKAASLGFVNLDDFDVSEYENYEQLRNGDLNWIVPQKFLAFLGPSTERGSSSHYPEKYLNYFMKNEVAAVIRLNGRTYETFRFTNAGILHYDMFFPDGSAPPKRILKQFLQVAESTRGAIAVHCKAGLGRTGTLIAAYIMKHYKMSAKEAIAWLRICRPGSVIGYQQTWLEEMEDSLWRDGRRFRLRHYGDENLILHHKHGIYSIEEKSDRKLRFRDYLSKRHFNRTISGICILNYAHLTNTCEQ